MGNEFSLKALLWRLFPASEALISAVEISDCHRCMRTGWHPLLCSRWAFGNLECGVTRFAGSVDSCRWCVSVRFHSLAKERLKCTLFAFKSRRLFSSPHVADCFCQHTPIRSRMPSHLEPDSGYLAPTTAAGWKLQNLGKRHC